MGNIDTAVAEIRATADPVTRGRPML